VTVPDLAAGDYLVRSEIIALHEGDREGKAQFYNGCGQIKVTSAGKLTIGSSAANIQSVYKSTDPGVLFNIYGGATSYKIPGPAVNAGFGGAASAPTTPQPTKAATSTAAKPTTLATVVKTTSPAATPTKDSSSGTVARWGQCGGQGYTGATACVSGSTCQKQNDYYFQCL